MRSLASTRAHRAVSKVLLALVVSGVVAGLLAGRSGPTAHPQARPEAPPALLRDRAPWPANNGPGLRVRLATLGLPALAQEGTALHIHSHLDVFVDGRRVVVPAEVGIDRDGRYISPLHTHDTTGVIHVESPVIRTFTLGEFLGVWGVRFAGGCLGAYCTGHGRVLRIYSDGRLVRNPQLLPLAEHEEIVVVYGTKRQLPRPIPRRYSFAPGL